MAKKTITTPRGTFLYPYLNDPDTKFDPEGKGHYRVRYKNTAEALADIMSKIDAAMDMSFENAVEQVREDKGAAAAKRVKRADTPYMEQDDGTIEINFKMKAAGIRKKDGKPWSRRPAIFDGQGNYIPTDRLPQIGGGTEGKVSFEIGPFYTALVGAGVSLRLNAVQILSLVEYGGGTAEEYGFESEDGGYVANSVQSMSDLEETTSEDEDTPVADDLKDF